MTDRDTPRRLEWAQLCNARDLGGQPTPLGLTRYGAVVRSEQLIRLTAAGRRAMLVYGIRTILDLRSAAELERDGVRSVEGTTHVHTAILDEDAMNDVANLDETLAVYRYMVEKRGSQIAEGLRALIGATGGVVVHCRAGKDRTGVLAGLLLDNAGVEREAIDADYALSDLWLQPLYREWAGEAGLEETVSTDQIRRYASPPGTMLSLLSELDRDYGGTPGYLLSIGLQSSEIEELAVVLRSPAGG